MTHKPEHKPFCARTQIKEDMLSAQVPSDLTVQHCALQLTQTHFDNITTLEVRKQQLEQEAVSTFTALLAVTGQPVVPKHKNRTPFFQQIRNALEGARK